MNASDVTYLLWDATLKSALLLLLVVAAGWLLRSVSAAHKHLLLTLTLGACLGLPLLSWLMPAWRVPLLPAKPQAQPHSLHKIEPTLAKLSPVAPLDEFEVDVPWLSSEPDAAPLATDWALVVLAIWSIGAWIVVAQLLIGTLLLWLLRQGAQPLDSTEWQAFVAVTGQMLGLRQGVKLYVSADVAMPMTTGLWRPIVFLPEAAMQWSRDQLRAVLLHELAHVKRRDCLTQWVATLACAMYWFNPLVWLAARQTRLTRELACDDEVLAVGTRASDYASCLVTIAQSVTPQPAPYISPVAVGMAGSQLGLRVTSILNPAQPRRVLSRRNFVMIALLIVSLVLPLAAFQPVAQTPQAAQEQRRQAAQQAEEKARAESQRAIQQDREVLAPERRALELLHERLGQEVDHERIAAEVERAQAEVQRLLQAHAGDADWQKRLTELRQQAQEMARQQELFQREFNVANEAELEAKIKQELERVAQARQEMMREMNVTNEAELKARLEVEAARATRHAAEALSDEQLQKLLREVTEGTLLLGSRPQLQARKLELQRLLEQLSQQFSVDSAEMMELKARLAVIEKELAKIRQ